MAAIATKKPFGDIGVAATFPYNFQQMFRGGTGYFPSGQGEAHQIMQGNDFQSEYHELKRLEANQSVMNRGQNNRTIDRKLLTGVHNFHVPKPVLGQRLYANPSMGAESYSSTRRDNGEAAPFRTIEVGAMGAGMRGGVLKTKEGYSFYKNKYNNRIGELNAIDALAVGYAVPMGQTMETYDNTKVGSPNKVEFFLLLRAVEDAVTEGDLTRFTFENLKNLILQLVIMSPTASMEDLNDIIDGVDIIIENLNLGLDEISENSAFNAFANPEYANTLNIFMGKLRDYAAEIMKNVYRSEKDKKTLAKSLIKSLGLDRLMRTKSPEGAVDVARKQSGRVDQMAADNDDGRNGGDDGRPYVQAPTREDEDQAGVARQPLAGRNGDPERERHGERRGDIANAPEYFDGPYVVAPLALSGSEQVEPPAQRDPRQLADAALDAASYILQPQMTSANRDLPEDELVMSLYPMTSNFVDEVTKRLEEQGFSPSEIAFGLSELPEFGDIFNEYIVDNQGAINPAPIGGPDAIRPGMPMPPAAAPMPPAAAPAPAKEKPVWNYPSDREKLRAELNTYAKIKAFGAKIPKEYGGPYKPRVGSYIKSSISHIIKLIKEIDPKY